MSAILYIPIGIVMAITNQQSSTYLVNQLICGLLFPGRPVANMVFVTYGYVGRPYIRDFLLPTNNRQITSLQGLKFTSDLKLGQYMKIPPRLLFGIQTSATVISSLVQIGVLNWMLSNIKGICTPEAVNGFTCPLAKVHFNGSILWGIIGPVRFFGNKALYRPLIWAFLIGAVAPIVVWILGRRGNKNFWSKVNLPIIFGSLSWIPPASGLNFSVWAIVCFVFNFHIIHRYSAWWKKYNMTLSAALDSGVALGVVLIFFGVYYPGWMDDFHWWGTEVYKQVSTERFFMMEQTLSDEMLYNRDATGRRVHIRILPQARNLVRKVGENAGRFWVRSGILKIMVFPLLQMPEQQTFFIRRFWINTEYVLTFISRLICIRLKAKVLSQITHPLVVKSKIPHKSCERVTAVIQVIQVSC